MAHHGKREIVLNSNGLSPYGSAQTRKTDHEFVEVGVSGQKLQIQTNWYEIFGTSLVRLFGNVIMQCNDLFFFKRICTKWTSSDIFSDESGIFFLTGLKIVTCRRLLPIRDFDKVGSTGVSGRFRVAERTHLWKVPWGFYSGFFFMRIQGYAVPPLEIR